MRCWDTVLLPSSPVNRSRPKGPDAATLWRSGRFRCYVRRLLILVRVVKRRGCLILGGALLFGLPSLVGVGLISAAFLSIRSPGAAPEAWAIIGVVVLLGSLLMAAIGAALGWLVARLMGDR